VTVEQLAADLRAGNRRALAKAITLVESTRADDQTVPNGSSSPPAEHGAVRRCDGRAWRRQEHVHRGPGSI
jgi:hypothetical protein